jgi:hypothetical protein
MFRGTRTVRKAILMAALAAAAWPAISLGQASTPAPSPKHKPILFHPPVSADQPLGERVGGGARAGGGTDASLVALVPEQVALTTQEQPSLFWFQTKEAKARLELTLIRPGNPTPLIALGAASAKPGIHRIRLSNHGVKLAPDVEYKWTVSLIPDPTNRSMDVVATGMVKRIEPSKELSQELAGANPEDRAGIFAEAGIWYDALGAISDEIDKSPGDGSLRAQRADLLKQVGLPPMDQQ